MPTQRRNTRRGCPLVGRREHGRIASAVATLDYSHPLLREFSANRDIVGTRSRGDGMVISFSGGTKRCVLIPIAERSSGSLEIDQSSARSSRSGSFGGAHRMCRSGACRRRGGRAQRAQRRRQADRDVPPRSITLTGGHDDVEAGRARLSKRARRRIHRTNTIEGSRVRVRSLAADDALDAVATNSSTHEPSTPPPLPSARRARNATATR